MKFYKATFVPKILSTRSGIIKLKEFELPSGEKYVCRLLGRNYQPTRWNTIEEAKTDLEGNYTLTALSTW